MYVILVGSWVSPPPRLVLISWTVAVLGTPFGSMLGRLISSFVHFGARLPGPSAGRVLSQSNRIKFLLDTKKDGCRLMWLQGLEAASWLS